MEVSGAEEFAEARAKTLGAGDYSKNVDAV